MLSQLVWPWLLSALIWLGPIPLAVWLVSRPQSAYENSAIAKLLLSTLTLWCLIQVALGLALGSVHQFALRPVLAIETTLAIAGLLLLYSSPKSRARVQQWWNTLAQPQLQPGEIFMLAALSFAALVLLQRIATQPFTNYDTLWFHGPIIARWYQTASLSQLDPLGNWILEHPDAQGYPYNWHVLSVFCLLPWGQDTFVALPMLVAWVMLGLSIYLLSREGGANRFYALAAATLVLVMPFLLNHVTTLHIDLPLAAIYTVSLYYLVAYYRTRQGWQAFLCLGSAGLLAGIKTPGVIYAALLIGLLGVAMKLTWPKTLTTTGRNLAPVGRDKTLKANCRSWHIFHSRSEVSLIWLGIIVGLGLGGFWYVNNSLSTGSLSATSLVAFGALDLPPQVVASPNNEVLPKLQGLWQRVLALQSTTLTAQFHWQNPSHWAIFGSQALVRLQLPLLALLGPVLLVPYAYLRSPKGDSRQWLQRYSMLLAITTFLYWNTPYSAGGDLSPLVGFNMRYGFPALGLLGVVAAISATQIKVPRAWVTAVVLLSSLLGIVSSAIFDKIRGQSIVGLNGFWPGQLINGLSEDPRNAIAALGQLVIDLGLTDILTYLALFIGICSLCLVGIYWPNTWRQLATRLSNWPSGVSQGFAILLSGMLLVAITGHWLQVRDINRLRLYRGIDQAIAQVVQPTQQIAYFSSSQSYILYGKHLDQAVLHLPPDAQNPDHWIDALRRANVALVAIGHNQLSAPRAKVFAEMTANQSPLIPLSSETAPHTLRLYRLAEQ